MRTALQEDFYAQELPLPMFGVHLRYPLSDALTVRADVAAGWLPPLNSLRSEGGEVELTQSTDEAMLGFEYRFAAHWQCRALWF